MGLDVSSILKSHVNIPTAFQELHGLAFAGHEIVHLINDGGRDLAAVRLVRALYSEVHCELPHHVPTARLHDPFVRVGPNKRTGLGAGSN